MAASYEKEYRELKEKYDKLTLEDKKNISWAIRLSYYNERKEEEKKVLQEKLDKFMNNVSNSLESLILNKQIEELTDKLHEAEKRELSDEKVCELEKSLYEYKEKYVNMFRENFLNEDLVKDLRRENKEIRERIEEDFMYKVNKLEITLDYERKELDDEIRSSNKIKQDLVNKLRKAESELNAFRTSGEMYMVSEYNSLGPARK
ncbi:DNA ligase 1-like [Cynara cardunculus var. scolymus]|uniref:DNA ligase 1-like n=1 Tax=Cynara cardunculus var. scolymus TaxID=59895 RepID=UPI000D629A28|nr:DNA ligase 1-like [Cynara cardunculus var. scolymus]